jgi:hypothetical protein
MLNNNLLCPAGHDQISPSKSDQRHRLLNHNQRDPLTWHIAGGLFSAGGLTKLSLSKTSKNKYNQRIPEHQS